MKKLIVLKLNDVTQGFDGTFYSEQLDCVLGDKYEHISETDYFWTDNNYLVDIEKDIDVNLPNIQNAIQAGATVETMYYVDHLFHPVGYSDFEDWIGTEGFSDCVEYGEEHGIIFALESDAKKYQSFLDLAKINNYLKKEEALQILKSANLEEIAKRLLKKQNYLVNGAVCYLNLESGGIVVSKSRSLRETEILIASLNKDYNRVDNREPDYTDYLDCSLEEYDSRRLASVLKLENYETQLDEFYEKTNRRLDEIYEELKNYIDLAQTWFDQF